MPFQIPNTTDAFDANQAEPDSQDFDAIIAGIGGTGVLTGCAVTAQGSPNMTVAVATGAVRIASNRVAVAGGNVTITTANASNPRFDLIVVNSSGTLSALAGTAAASPVFPAFDEVNYVLLAAVIVPANDTTIAANQIVDKRIVLFSGRDAVRFVVSSTADQREKDGADYLCDGTADEVEINQALTDCATTGGKITLSTGQFNTAAPILIQKDNIQLLGTSPGARSGSGQSGIGTTIKAAAGFTGSDMILVQGAANTQPVHGTNLRDFMVDGNNVAGPFNGITFRVNRGLIDNVHVWRCTGDGIRVQGYSSWSTYDTVLRDVQSANCGAAGLRFWGRAEDLHLIHSIIHGNVDGLVFDKVGSDGASSAQITGSHFYDNSHYQIWFRGTGSRTKIVNCKIEGTGSGANQHGIYLDNSVSGFSTLLIVGCGFKDIGQGTTNTYDCIGLSAGGAGARGISGVVIVGCSFNQTVANKPRYGVNLSDASAQGWVVTNNTFDGPTSFGTAAINNQGNTTATTRCTVRDNSNWITENSGTGTIASGATTVNITHGLDVTPAAKDIQLTPTNIPTNKPRMLAVTAVSSTTFTVTTDSDPGASTLTFAWYASVLYR